MKLTIELTRATDLTEETWVSHCLELDAISQGRYPKEALEAVAEAVDMMVHDEIAKFESSGQTEKPGWERAFGNIADEIARRDAATPSPFIALMPPPTPDQLQGVTIIEEPAPRSEVDTLRAALAEIAEAVDSAESDRVGGSEFYSLGWLDTIKSVLARVKGEPPPAPSVLGPIEVEPTPQGS